LGFTDKNADSREKMLVALSLLFSIYNDAGQKGYKVVTLCNNYNSNSGKINPILPFPSFLTVASAYCTIWRANVDKILSDILSPTVAFHLIFIFLLCNFTLPFLARNQVLWLISGIFTGYVKM